MPMLQANRKTPRSFPQRHQHKNNSHHRNPRPRRTIPRTHKNNLHPVRSRLHRNQHLSGAFTRARLHHPPIHLHTPRRIIKQMQGEVRYWLHDLAVEISAAEKDGTLPELALDRIWITGEGRAKLLDFPARGLTPSNQITLQPCSSFLSAVAAMALTGSAGASAKAPAKVWIQRDARGVLKSLPQFVGAEPEAAEVQ